MAIGYRLLFPLHLVAYKFHLVALYIPSTFVLRNYLCMCVCAWGVEVGVHVKSSPWKAEELVGPLEMEL